MECLVTTVSGHVFDMLNPDPAKIHKADCLYSLFNLNRYLGHTKPVWPVLRHSLACAMIARDLGNDADTCLVSQYHDFAESLFGDIHGPLKTYLASAVDPIEAGIEQAVAHAMNLPGWFADKYDSRRGYVKYLDYLTYHGEVLYLKLKGHSLKRVAPETQAIVVDCVAQVAYLDYDSLLSLWDTLEGKFRARL